MNNTYAEEGQMTYYPYNEDQAGILRDTHETGKSSEALLADNEIISLAQRLLSATTFSEAEDLAVRLTKSKSLKDAARVKLMTILPSPPKRPIYYLEHELQLLPHWTRNSMRYLGDYIDMLVKAAVFEKVNDQRVFHNSFGPAIDGFKRAYPAETEVIACLSSYNKFLYKDAKHDMTLPSGRKEHRFTSREVVLTLFITRELSDRLTSISSIALKVKNDQRIP
jgi:hypothetical protein